MMTSKMVEEVIEKRMKEILEAFMKQEITASDAIEEMRREEGAAWNLYRRLDSERPKDDSIWF